MNSLKAAAKAKTFRGLRQSTAATDLPPPAPMPMMADGGTYGIQASAPGFQASISDLGGSATGNVLDNVSTDIRDQGAVRAIVGTGQQAVAGAGLRAGRSPAPRPFARPAGVTAEADADVTKPIGLADGGYPMRRPGDPVVGTRGPVAGVTGGGLSAPAVQQSLRQPMPQPAPMQAPSATPAADTLSVSNAVTGGFQNVLDERARNMEAQVGLADGGSHNGLVRGPGTGTSDSVPARYSAGEYVLPADTVQHLGVENLDAIKDATHVPAAVQGRGLRMANGGFGPAVSPLLRKAPTTDQLYANQDAQDALPRVDPNAAAHAATTAAYAGMNQAGAADRATTGIDPYAAGLKNSVAARKPQYAPDPTSPDYSSVPTGGADADLGAAISSATRDGPGQPVNNGFIGEGVNRLLHPFGSSAPAPAAAPATPAVSGSYPDVRGTMTDAPAAPPTANEAALAGLDSKSMSPLGRVSVADQRAAPVTSAEGLRGGKTLNATAGVPNGAAGQNAINKDNANANYQASAAGLRTGVATQVGGGTTGDKIYAVKGANGQVTFSGAGDGSASDAYANTSQYKDGVARAQADKDQLASIQEGHRQDELVGNLANSSIGGLKANRMALEQSFKDRELKQSLANTRYTNGLRLRQEQFNADRTHSLAVDSHALARDQFGREKSKDAFSQNNTANDENDKQLNSFFTNGTDKDGKPMLDVAGKTAALDAMKRTLAAHPGSTMQDLTDLHKQQIMGAADLMGRVNKDGSNLNPFAPDYISDAQPEDLIGMKKNDSGDYVIPRGKAANKVIPGRYVDQVAPDRFNGQTADKYKFLKG